MARFPALQTVVNTFHTKVSSSVELYKLVEMWAYGTWEAIQGAEVFYPSQARKVVSLAFLYVVVGWEDFVEACFVRYLAGASSPSGYKPSLRLGACDSLAHAYETISGVRGFDPEKNYLNWSDWKNVMDKAYIFFEKGKPFSLLTDQEKQRLSDAFSIRNRIAHSSRKCQQEFIKIAKQHLGLRPNEALRQGFDVGQLLIEISNRGFPQRKPEPFFMQYMNMFLEMTNKLAPK
ncbi:MAG: hypothetical protein L6290_04950 [Thermodesulfovibrionales bacterium]|nr:hypothetical protein [Thermodesulfovibrionales bacterium]